MADSNDPRRPSHSSDSDHPPLRTPTPPSNSIVRSRPQRAIVNSWVNFLPHIPPAFYHKIYLLFVMFSLEWLATPSFELEMILLTRDSPEALKEFKKLLPTAASPSSTFNDRVRDRLYDDTEGYAMWLEDLCHFNAGRISFPELREQVEPLFDIMPDLWEEFDSNFGYADGVKGNFAADAENSNQGSTSVDTLPDTQRSKSE